MVACVKIARTCLLKVTNKIIQNKIIQNKIIQNKIIQNKIIQKTKKQKTKNKKTKNKKTKNKKQKTKKIKTQCPSKDIVFYASYGRLHHRATHIIGQITSFHILPHTLQPSLGKRP